MSRFEDTACHHKYAGLERSTAQVFVYHSVGECAGALSEGLRGRLLDPIQSYLDGSVSRHGTEKDIPSSIESRGGIEMISDTRYNAP